MWGRLTDRDRFGDQLRDIDRFLRYARFAAEDQQVVHHFGGALPVRVDALQRRSMWGFTVQGRHEQLGVAEYTLERVLHLVRDVGDELAERGQFLRLSELRAHLLEVPVPPDDLLQHEQVFDGHRKLPGEVACELHAEIHRDRGGFAVDGQRAEHSAPCAEGRDQTRGIAAAGHLRSVAAQGACQRGVLFALDGRAWFLPRIRGGAQGQQVRASIVEPDRGVAGAEDRRHLTGQGFERRWQRRLGRHRPGKHEERLLEALADGKFPGQAFQVGGSHSGVGAF